MTVDRSAAAARGQEPRRNARGVAWGVLAGTAGAELAFNIVHATSHLEVALAVLYGVAPVATAIGLSHIVAACRGGWLMRTITVVIMLGAMALSVGAVATVVAPAAPGLLRYLFPAVLDAAAMVALQVVLSPRPDTAGEVAGATSAPGATNLPAAAPSVPATRATAGTATNAMVAPPAADGPATTTRPQPPGNGPAMTTPAVAAGHAPGRDGQDGPAAAAGVSGAAAAGGQRVPGNISDARGRRGETRQAMRDYWEKEIAESRIPTGADLNRAAGKDAGYSLGKKYASEWRQEIPGDMRADWPASAVPSAFSGEGGR